MKHSFIYLLLPAALLLASCGDADILDRNGDGDYNDLVANRLGGARTQHFSGTQLISNANYQLAVGFCYDPTKDMGQGTGYQIFDIEGLDKVQQKAQHLYICDDQLPTSTQEVVTAHTEQDLHTNLQISGSAGLGLYGVKVTVSGGFSKEDFESITKEYGMMRMSNTKFTRDMQYENVIADLDSVPNLDEQIFTPVFAKDRRDLLAYNSQTRRDETDFRNDVHNFLLRWGACFATHSEMGCSLDYILSIDKSVLSSTITVDAAIQATLAESVLKADVGVELQNTQEQIKGHYEYTLEARGGDVQLVSIINAGGTLTPEMFKAWGESIKYGSTTAENNCVLVNVRLASIALLFTGDVKTEMQRQIDNWPEY